ncbi:MAG TPA: ABC transporter substrate-binding protein [Polyangia bacterium]|nr:ABC transporter substrate-binding protein [Polyangia bacterium]
MPTSRLLATFLTATSLTLVALVAAPTAHAEAAAKKSKKAAAAKTEGDAAKSDGQTDAPATGGSTALPTASPMAELKKSNLALDKVLTKNVPNWTPEAELQRTEVRKIVGSFLDYGELARRSLAKHWDTLTPKQREDFSNTLRELVERNYLRQLHGNANYNIKYEKEEKAGNEATVDATLHTMSRGKKVEIAMQYKMLAKNGQWVVYDVLTDEQSMLENYRAEFNKIITKDGFDALMKRMKKKLDEKEE